MGPLAALRSCFGRQARAEEERVTTTSIRSVNEVRQSDQTVDRRTPTTRASVSVSLGQPNRPVPSTIPNTEADRIASQVYRRSVIRAAEPLLARYPGLAKLTGEQGIEGSLGRWALVLSAASAIKADRVLSAAALSAVEAFTDKLQDLSDQLNLVMKPHKHAGPAVDVDNLAHKAFLAIGRSEALPHLTEAYLFPEFAQSIVEANAAALSGNITELLELDHVAVGDYIRTLDDRINQSTGLKDVMEMFFAVCKLVKIPMSSLGERLAR